MTQLEELKKYLDYQIEQKERELIGVEASISALNSIRASLQHIMNKPPKQP